MGFLRADRIVLDGGILLLIKLVLTDISAVGGFECSRKKVLSDLAIFVAH